MLYGVKLKKKGAHGNNTSKESAEELACTSINTGSDIISMCIVLVQIKQGESGKVCQPYVILDNCSQGTFILDQLTKSVSISGRQKSVTIKMENIQALP